MPVYRIRCCFGYKGHSHHYMHADVIAKNPQSALKAARENRVRNWRRIDSFDTASETYRTYELIGRLDKQEWHAREPVSAEDVKRKKAC